MIIGSFIQPFHAHNVEGRSVYVTIVPITKNYFPSMTDKKYYMNILTSVPTVAAHCWQQRLAMVILLLVVKGSDIQYRLHRIANYNIFKTVLPFNPIIQNQQQISLQCMATHTK